MASFCTTTLLSRATITLLMPTAVDLLHTLAGTPNLPGAACVTHRDVFDACTDRRARGAYRHAIHICTGCPSWAPAPRGSPACRRRSARSG